MRKLLVLGVAAALMVAAVPVASADGHDGPGTIVDTVVAVSGEPGTFDKDKKDYDLLREAVLAAGLAEALAAAEGITVFAPNDKAFHQLAKELGYKGGYDEGAILGFLVGGLAAYGGDPIPVLTNVLLYHVVPAELTRDDIAEQGIFPTLLDGAAFAADKNKLIDNEPDLKNPKLKEPADVVASNGIIQTIDRVLIPVADLAD